MIMFGLAAFSVLLAAALIIVLMRGRRGRLLRRSGPRTVAELVQLRAAVVAEPDQAAVDEPSVSDRVESTEHSAAEPAADGPFESLNPDAADLADVTGADAVEADAADDAVEADIPAVAGSSGAAEIPRTRASRPTGAESSTRGARTRAVWTRVMRAGTRSAAAGPAESAAEEPAAGEPAAGEPAAIELAAVESAAADTVAAEPVTAEEPVTPVNGIPVVPSTSAVQPASIGSDTDPDVGDAERPRALRLVPPLPAGEPESPRGDRGPDPTADADRVVLGALGLVDPDAEPHPVLEPSVVDRRPVVASEVAGAAGPVRFRVARRDGSAVPGAVATLLDRCGAELITGYADADGFGELCAPHPGEHLLLAAAPGHQPAAAAAVVGDEPIEVEFVLARSAVLTGVVHGEHGPVVAARLTLVQDGEIVDAAHSDAIGEYRIGGLAAGGYSLSATAPGRLPVVVRCQLAAEADLRRDVELVRDRELDWDVDAEPLTMPIPVQSRAAAREAVVHR